MLTSFPPDVIVFDQDSMLHARFARGRKGAQLLSAKSYRLPDGTFSFGAVSPSIEKQEAIAEVVRRIRTESGRLESVSILLPDTWFRIHILEVGTLPDRKAEADEVVRWTLDRSMPLEASQLRIAYDVLSRNGAAANLRLLVMAGLETTLSALEEIFTRNGVAVTAIESIGMNLWNAITVRETPTSKDRILLYLRSRDFTLVVFRGTTPVFVRSRRISQERSIVQELRLSASYLKANVQTNGIEMCYVAGSDLDADFLELIRHEFNGPVRQIGLDQFAQVPADMNVSRMDAELAACTGVFTS